MTRYRLLKYICIYLCFLFLPCMLFARENILDPDVEKEVRKLTEKYIETFTLSDFDGNYSPAHDSIFQSLFAENAVITNFLPGTLSYRRNISVDSYRQLLRSYFDNQRVSYTGRADIHYTEALDKSVSSDLLRFETKLSTSLIIYSNDFESSIDLNLKQILLIEVNLKEETFEIVSVLDASPVFVDLDFYVIDTNRKPLSGVAINFSYDDQSGQNTITRKRQTDESGRLSISYIPVDKMIHILADGYSLLLEDMLTGRQWYELPPAQRILFLKEEQDESRIKRWIRAGYWQDFFMQNEVYHQNHGFLINNQDMSFDRSHGVFFNVAIELLSRNQNALFVGTGIEYMEGSFHTIIESAEQIFNQMSDQDEDAFDLIILAENIHESYTYQSLGVPLLFGYRYYNGQKRLHSIELSAKFIYVFVNDLSYQAHLTQETMGDYEQYGLILSRLPSYYFDHYIIEEDSPIIGEFSNSLDYSFELQIAANFRLSGNSLFLQPSITYHLSQFGRKEPNYISPVNQIENMHYYYNPSLSGFTFFQGVIGFGISLLWSI